LHRCGGGYRAGPPARRQSRRLDYGLLGAYQRAGRSAQDARASEQFFERRLLPGLTSSTSASPGSNQDRRASRPRATLGLLAHAAAMRDPRARSRADSPATGDNVPQGDAPQPNLPVGLVASTRDTPPRCALRGVGFPIPRHRSRLNFSRAPCNRTLKPVCSFALKEHDTREEIHTD
jgi:hypothetical protein